MIFLLEKQYNCCTFQMPFSGLHHP